MICWFQDASYKLKIIDATTGMQSLSTRIGSYRGSAVVTISEAYDAGFDMERVYDVIVVIDTQTGTRNSSSRFSK